jgi:hypothetical protein
MGSIAIGSVVFSVAKRSLAEYSRMLPAGLGILASGASLYILTRSTSKFGSEEAKEVKAITDELKRNEIVWKSIPIPGLAEHIQKLLSSDRISDIRACKCLIDPMAVVGIRIGGDEADWILPQGVSESESVKIIIGEKNHRQKEVVVSKKRSAEILNQLGIEENENRSFANLTSLSIRVEDSKVSRVSLFWPENKSEVITYENSAELQFKYVLGKSPLLTPCETYTPKQKRIAEIYLHTLIAKNKPFHLAAVVTNPDFSKVLDALMSLGSEEECICIGPAKYRNGLNLDIVDRVEMSQEPYVSHSHEPQFTVFNLDKLKDLPRTYSIPFELGNRFVYINYEGVQNLLVQVAQIQALRKLQLDSGAGSCVVPSELKHDKTSTDEAYQKNLKFLTWYGLPGQLKLGFYNEGTSRMACSVELNISSILEELHKPEKIQSIKIEGDNILFFLTEAGHYSMYLMTLSKDEAKRGFGQPEWGN